jgi:hypothetical protein
VTAVTEVETITHAIREIRGQRVLLDAELAALYGVTTKRLNEQVRRNLDRFPADFMFQLTAEEAGALRSHSATLKTGRGQHRKYPPFAFTEHGAIMAATVLNSPRAVEMSIYQGVEKCFPCISQQSLAKGATFAALPKSST